MPAIESPLMSSDDAAAYLGIAKITLAHWRSLGRHGIPYAKVGRLCKYRKTDLDKFLAEHTDGAAA